MDFNPESKGSKKFQEDIQRDVADLRTCQVQREKLIKELESQKNDIKSIQEWVKNNGTDIRDICSGK